MRILKENKINMRQVRRYVSALLFIVAIGALSWSGWFMYSTMTDIAEVAEVSDADSSDVEQINEELLNRILEHMEKKTALDEPRESELYNPFAKPPPLPTEEPAVQP